MVEKLKAFTPANDVKKGIGSLSHFFFFPFLSPHSFSVHLNLLSFFLLVSLDTLESLSTSSNNNNGDNQQRKKVDPIALAKKVLELSEFDDNLGILNLGGAGLVETCNNNNNK